MKNPSTTITHSKKSARKKVSRPRPARNPTTLKTRIDKLEGLLDVAKAMTAERDLDQLLRLILDESVKIVSADRCSIWIVDRERGEIWTKVAHGLDKQQTIRIPIGVGIAGQVAASGEIINIPDAYKDPRFNRQVDKDTGYRTRNILGVPMRYTSGEVTGVLQALNKKRGKSFDDEDAELLLALGANAAAAVENAILYDEIGRLFEGFVKASVVAIESRDPTTSGHSERVADLTLGIAENIDQVTTGPYANIIFTPEDMREIRYAALLHDFGKVGVRENVLIKAEKLYPEELELIAARFQMLKAERRCEHLESKLAARQAQGDIPLIQDNSLQQQLDQLDEYFNIICTCNRPTVLDSHHFEQLNDIASIQYRNRQGKLVPILSDSELKRLSIPRGSLDHDERFEIESHVTHTFRFLSKIPWTRDLRRVPEIAYSHHEKLDGAGYPRQLQAEQIPLQARIMSIADMYDALTASDRPYKKAVSHERAVSILEDECKQAKLDRTLLDVFLDAEIHLRVR